MAARFIEKPDGNVWPTVSGHRPRSVNGVKNSFGIGCVDQDQVILGFICHFCGIQIPVNVYNT